MYWEANRTISSGEGWGSLFGYICIQQVEYCKSWRRGGGSSRAKIGGDLGWVMFIGSCLLHAGAKSPLYFHSSDTITL